MCYVIETVFGHSRLRSALSVIKGILLKLVADGLIDKDGRDIPTLSVAEPETLTESETVVK